MSKDAREALLRQHIAANMTHYRKLHNMTQSDLAERISYSDKSVSKWERAEGVPDIYVLTLLSELFSVSVNDLISENATLPPPVTNTTKNRVIVLLMYIGIVWLAATVVYTVLQVFAPSLTWAGHSFIIAIPVSCIVAVVFTSLWWDLWVRFLAVSALVWSIAASVYILLPLTNLSLIFAVGAVLQVLIILWFLFLKNQKLLKKIEKDLFSRRDRKPKA